MGVLDWIPDPMVRKSGQTSRDRAVCLVYMDVEKVDLRFEYFFRLILQCSSSNMIKKAQYENSPYLSRCE